MLCKYILKTWKFKLNISAIQLKLGQYAEYFDCYKADMMENFPSVGNVIIYLKRMKRCI